MKVAQIYEILNNIATEVLGNGELLQEDLSNIVDLGKAFEDAGKFDNYVRALPDQVGKIIFNAREYDGAVPSVLYDAWEWGSIVEKINIEMPQATENESWELTNGSSYDTNIFTKPTVTVKAFNDRVTYEVPMSFTSLQIKSSLQSAEQANSFISAIRTAIKNAVNIRNEALIMRTINNMIGETLYDDYKAAGYDTKSGTKAVNLLYLYNQRFGTNLDKSLATSNLDFLKFASATIAKYTDRVARLSTLFNIEKKERFTPRDKMHLVMLSDFKRDTDVYLQSPTFHDEYTALPESESVAYWQAPGTDYSFDNVSAIKIKTASGHTIDASGILAVIFDHDALGVTNMNPRTPSHYVEKAEFWNEWFKWDAGYFNDLAEQMVVFFIA